MFRYIKEQKNENKKIKNNFIITAFDYSGAEFLFNIISRSKLWTVGRKDGNNSGFRILDLILDYSDKDYHCEVDACLREILHLIPVEKKGIIFRNPSAIILSIANNVGLEAIGRVAGELYYYYWQFRNLITQNSKISIIDFHRMTTDILYLKQILLTFNINDVDVSEEDFKNTVDNDKFIKYKNFDELPQNIRMFVKTIPYIPQSRLVR
jgi:hypothetical protein